MDSLLSKIVFENILDGSCQITGIVLPSHSAITGKPLDQLNLISSDSIESIALTNQVPVFHVNGKNPNKYSDILNKTRPDIIIVACFPYKLPSLVCQFPDSGAYNIHPSYLPKYRGPVPLFWQFYYGESNTGISIHKLSEDLDQGDIAAQESVPFNDGFSTADATSSIATTAADMLKTLTRQLEDNSQKFTPQNEDEASYYSWPKQSDFVIPTEWGVARAYNFIKGTMQWGQDYIIRSESEDFIIKSASSYSRSPCPDNKAGILNKYIIEFSDGCLFAD